MRIRKAAVRFGLIFLFAAGALLVTVRVTSKARAAAGYTDASIRGTYAYEAVAFVEVNPNPDPNLGPLTGDYAPFSAAGFITFDGIGGMHIHDTVNIQGGIRHRNFSGTYSINADGSGTLTFLSFAGTPKTRELFIAKSGQEIKYVVTDNPDDGAINAGTLVRQGPPPED